jgi:hypothetical protein
VEIMPAKLPRTFIIWKLENGQRLSEYFLFFPS